MIHAGVLYTTLAVRVAYIIRCSFYCQRDAEELSGEL